MIECYANTPFSYQFNMNLDGSQSWTATASVVTLDYAEILDASNNDLSLISANVTSTNSNLPNPNNFSVILTANSTQTALYGQNGVDPVERVVIIQTVLTSNTGQKQHANNLYLKVKTSTL